MGTVCSSEKGSQKSTGAKKRKKKHSLSRNKNSPTAENLDKSKKTSDGWRKSSASAGTGQASRSCAREAEDRPLVPEQLPAASVSLQALISEDGGEGVANPFERPRSHSNASQTLRERLKKFDQTSNLQAKQIAAEAAIKRLDEAKKLRLQSWIDSTSKADLLDPQDVKGYLQRRAAQEQQDQQQQTAADRGAGLRQQLILSQRRDSDPDDEPLRRSSGACSSRRDSSAQSGDGTSTE